MEWDLGGQKNTESLHVMSETGRRCVPRNVGNHLQDCMASHGQLLMRLKIFEHNAGTAYSELLFACVLARTLEVNTGTGIGTKN
jgi:hypothetical protein